MWSGWNRRYLPTYVHGIVPAAARFSNQLASTPRYGAACSAVKSAWSGPRERSPFAMAGESKESASYDSGTTRTPGRRRR